MSYNRKYQDWRKHILNNAPFSCKNMLSKLQITTSTSNPKTKSITLNHDLFISSGIDQIKAYLSWMVIEEHPKQPFGPFPLHHEW